MLSTTLLVFLVAISILMLPKAMKAIKMYEKNAYFGNPDKERLQEAKELLKKNTIPTGVVIFITGFLSLYLTVTTNINSHFLVIICVIISLSFGAVGFYFMCEGFDKGVLHPFEGTKPMKE